MLKDLYPPMYRRRLKIYLTLQFESRFDIRTITEDSIIGLWDSCKVKMNGPDQLTAKDSLVRHLEDVNWVPKTQDHSSKKLKHENIKSN